MSKKANITGPTYHNIYEQHTSAFLAKQHIQLNIDFSHGLTNAWIFLDFVATIFCKMVSIRIMISATSPVSYLFIGCDKYVL